MRLTVLRLNARGQRGVSPAACGSSAGADVVYSDLCSHGIDRAAFSTAPSGTRHCDVRGQKDGCSSQCRLCRRDGKEAGRSEAAQGRLGLGGAASPEALTSAWPRGQEAGRGGHHGLCRCLSPERMRSQLPGEPPPTSQRRREPFPPTLSLC